MSESLIQIRQLSHSYGDKPVLDQLSAELYGGEIIAILGANGTGKTTLIQLLLGMLRLQHGEISVLGQSPAQLRRDPRLSSQIGVMLQQASLPGQLTVLEQLQLFSAYYPAPLPLPTLLERFALQPVLQQRCSSLSGGQRQALLLALALLGQPKILFLDEPTVGMDAEARQRFWQQIRAAKSAGICVLLTTHYLEEADALADRVLLLKDGSFIADTTPAQLKAGLQHRRIRCRSRLSAEILHGLPGVSAVTAFADQWIELDCSAVEACLRQLLALDSTLNELTVSAASLEQAFLQLTGSAATPVTVPHRSLQHEHPIVEKLVKPVAAIALYVLEARLDLLSLLRTPGFILPCLAFPVLFYLLFGVMLGHGKHADYLLVSYAAFGVMGPALFNFGANIATEREQGWLTLKQISPAPLGSWLFGKTLSCLLLALLIILLLFVCAALVAGVRLYTSQWLQLAAVMLLGTIPFCLLGLTLGLSLSAKSAPATINLIYLPLAFLGGLWLPLQLLPATLQQLALLLPSYHLGQLGYAVIGQDRGEPMWVNAAVLLVYSLLFALIAHRRFRAQSSDRR